MVWACVGTICWGPFYYGEEKLVPKSQLGAYCHTHPVQLHPHFLLIFAGYKYQLYGNESKLSILSTAMLSHSHSLLSDIFSFVPILAFVLPSLDSFKITLPHTPRPNPTYIVSILSNNLYKTLIFQKSSAIVDQSKRRPPTPL